LGFLDKRFRYLGMGGAGCGVWGAGRSVNLKLKSDN
jgi:hypothetical protein